MAGRYGGKPVWRRGQEVLVFVTVEEKGRAPYIRRWRGSTCKGIKAAARKKYAGARLGFGDCVYRTI